MIKIILGGLLIAIGMTVSVMDAVDDEIRRFNARKERERRRD